MESSLLVTLAVNIGLIMAFSWFGFKLVGSYRRGAAISDSQHNSRSQDCSKLRFESALDYRD